MVELARVIDVFQGGNGEANPGSYTSTYICSKCDSEPHAMVGRTMPCYSVCVLKDRAREWGV